MECFETFSKSLRKKNVKAVVTCLNVNKLFKSVENLKELIFNIISELNLIDSRIIESIVFVDNEPIGTNYMLYRFRIFLRNYSGYVSVRVVVKENIVHSISFVIGKKVPYRRTVKSASEPRVCRDSTISGNTPHGQKYMHNFVIYRILGQPEVDVRKWKLTVEGLVRKKLEYTYNVLLSMKHVRLIADFHRVTGWSAKDIVWEGIPLRKLVGENNILPNVKWAYVESLDGYTTVIPISDFLSEKSLLILKINGEFLSLEQGFPARIFIPHLYGWKGAK